MPKYFNLIPTGGNYIGKVTIPPPNNMKWKEAPNSIISVEGFIEWHKSTGSCNPYICIFFSIWSGLDISTFEYLVDKSKLTKKIDHYYVMYDTYEFIKNISGDFNVNHPPVVFWGVKSDLLGLESGKIPLDMLDEIYSKIHDF